MIDTITYGHRYYPKFQSEGFAAKFAFPFAMEVCKGQGLDIGCGKIEWKFPDAFPVDPVLGMNGHTAENLPKNVHSPYGEWDYIFSSHCLEHVTDWVSALDHWLYMLKNGGTLFLYLPAYSQIYWRPWNNRKHRHVLTPEIIRDYLDSKLCHRIFVSGIDLNDSFMVMAQK